jgi:hypothetical protein
MTYEQFVLKSLTVADLFAWGYVFSGRESETLRSVSFTTVAICLGCSMPWIVYKIVVRPVIALYHWLNQYALRAPQKTQTEIVFIDDT